MKIAICSDSHDNIVNISAFLLYCKKNKIKNILHCGDWCAPSVLKFFRENFKGKIYGVYGNVCADDKTMQKFGAENKIILNKDKCVVEISGIKMIIVHYPEFAKELAQTDKFDIIFYGHNHKPWMEKHNKTFLVNPGTLAGMFQRATFATYDIKTRKLDLKILDHLNIENNK